MIDLLKGVREYVYPVGRLDYDSEGLLILTNDGDLAARLHPPAPRRAARLRSDECSAARTSTMSSRLAKGVTIDGQRTGPAEVTSIGPSRLRITVREGRNRQVRKMCDAIGHPVDGAAAGRDRSGCATRSSKLGCVAALTAHEVERDRARRHAASSRPSGLPVDRPAR